MKEKVFFIPVQDNEDDSAICARVSKAIGSLGLLDFINERDMVALKTHFGEQAHLGFVRPLYLAMLGGLVRERSAVPFMTETSTLYKGNRNNAVRHIELANMHGFGFEKTGMSLVMADGLFGDDEVEVGIPGKLYRSVKIASVIAKVQAMIVVSHFTGHPLAGFGAALKNIGMGCASRKGKMQQHSTAKPSIKKKNCTRCGECVKWCPAGAITLTEESAVIDRDLCIGCGQCLSMCRFDAVKYNWKVTSTDLQEKIVEHAWGVEQALKGNTLYLNFLTRITKDCDCMTGFEKIMPDAGVLISADPVAVDAASIDLVEERAGKKLGEIAHDLPCRHQVEYARAIGFGSPDYELVHV